MLAPRSVGDDWQPAIWVPLLSVSCGDWRDWHPDRLGRGRGSTIGRWRPDRERSEVGVDALWQTSDIPPEQGDGLTAGKAIGHAADIGDRLVQRLGLPASASVTSGSRAGCVGVVLDEGLQQRR